MPFSSSIRKDLMENLLVFEYKFKKNLLLVFLVTCYIIKSVFWKKCLISISPRITSSDSLDF